MLMHPMIKMNKIMFIMICNIHTDDCDEIMILGLADVSYMSIFDDFDEIVTYGKDMFHDRIIDDFLW